jgi:hypothetical protein
VARLQGLTSRAESSHLPVRLTYVRANLGHLRSFLDAVLQSR